MPPAGNQRGAALSGMQPSRQRYGALAWPLLSWRGLRDAATTLHLDGLGRDGIDDRYHRCPICHSLQDAARPGDNLQVFTLHAELEGMRLLGAFESLLLKWQAAGANVVAMAKIHALARERSWPDQIVAMGEVPGRSGLLAVQPVSAGA